MHFHSTLVGCECDVTMGGTRNPKLGEGGQEQGYGEAIEIGVSGYNVDVNVHQMIQNTQYIAKHHNTCTVSHTRTHYNYSHSSCLPCSEFKSSKNAYSCGARNFVPGWLSPSPLPSSLSFPVPFPLPSIPPSLPSPPSPSPAYSTCP